MANIKFKLVDLTSFIRQAVSSFTGVSGFAAGHITVTTENDQKLVVVVPIQSGPSDPNTGGYGDDQWGPCPVDLRSENYHDPIVPGTVNPVDSSYTWVQDKGYQQNAPDQAEGALATFKARVSQAATDYANATGAK
jgi:hypothetical protein